MPRQRKEKGGVRLDFLTVQGMRKLHMLWTSSNKHIHRIPNFFYLILIFMLYSSQKNIYLILYINPSIKLYYISVKKEKKRSMDAVFREYPWFAVPF